MRSMQVISSAALFYNAEQREAIPLTWSQRAIELFSKHRLSPVLFTAAGGAFELDDCYVFGDAGSDLVKWGEPITARRDELLDALKKRVIYDLGFDTPLPDAADRSDWRANVSASSINGEFYVGVEQELASDLAVLLRWACDTARGLFDVRYGFGYKMPLAEDPDCYASGSGKTSLADVFEMIRHRPEWERRVKTPDELWSEEMRGRRRYLTGLFRGAYPVNILSESHLAKAELVSAGVGRLTKLNSSLWLWEISEVELPEAQTILDAHNALVSQAASL